MALTPEQKRRIHEEVQGPEWAWTEANKALLMRTDLPRLLRERIEQGRSSLTEVEVDA